MRARTPSGHTVLLGAPVSGMDGWSGMEGPASLVQMKAWGIHFEATREGKESPQLLQCLEKN
jgi:hypothetical protein